MKSISLGINSLFNTILFCILITFILCGRLTYVNAQVYTGNLSLTNQTAIDTILPYTEITGDLSISGGRISNLDSLYRITKIGGNLKFSWASILKSIDGLSNLTHIGKNIEMYVGGTSSANDSLTNLNGFSGLTHVGGTIEIARYNALTDISGLGGLSKLMDKLTLEDNQILPNLDGLLNIDRIESLTIKSNPSLVNIDGLSGIVYASGNIEIQNNAQLANFDGFSSLAHCEGNFIISGNSSLSNIDGLSNLDTVGMSLQIGGSLDPSALDQLTNLNGLSGLVYVGRGISIVRNYSLIDISGLSSLQNVKFGIYVNDNVSLENLDGLTGLDTLEVVSIARNTSLKNIDGLLGLSYLNIGINISENPQLMNIDGFSKLNYYGESLFIRKNKSLEHLEGLSNLTSIGTNVSVPNQTCLSIEENSALRTLDGLRNIQTVGGSISIKSNQSLQNIDGLINITSVPGYLTISRNWSLGDLYGLRNLVYSGLGVLVFVQPSLNDCCGLYDYLSSVDSVTASDVFILTGPRCTAERVLLNGPCEAEGPLLTGSAFLDLNDDCQVDSLDLPIAWKMVKFEPGPLFGLTNQDGQYQVNADSGIYSVDIASNQLQEVCDSNLSVVVMPGDSLVEVEDISVSGEACPDLSLQISGFWNRRCFPGEITIWYCNEGLIPSTQTTITVKLPEYLEYTSASLISSFDADSNLVFNVGSLNPGQCGFIIIKSRISCQAVEILGLTQCIEAWMYSPDICPPIAQTWSGASLYLEAGCINHTNRFWVINQGGGDMDDSVDYRIWADTLLVQMGKLKLGSLDTLIIDIPGNGHMYRLEVDQVFGHPTNTHVSAALEGCVPILTSNSSRGLISRFATPIRQPEPEFAVTCRPIVGSYDPNDKQNFPQGLGDMGLTPPDTRLEYFIRFQNTGSDTAFHVMITDTLSPDLDLFTLQLGAYSHPYELEVTNSDPHIMKFRFLNIMLPDSNVNEPASHGFVQFFIKPLTDATQGTVIQNNASIYFDFNPPIKTNTVINTIFDSIPQALGSISGIIQNYHPRSSDGLFDETPFEYRLYPNPAEDILNISIDQFHGHQLSLEWWDINGRLIDQKTLKVAGNSQVFSLDTSHLPTGVYFLQINKRYYHKIIVR